MRTCSKSLPIALSVLLSASLAACSSEGDASKTGRQQSGMDAGTTNDDTPAEDDDSSSGGAEPEPEPATEPEGVAPNPGSEPAPGSEPEPSSTPEPTTDDPRGNLPPTVRPACEAWCDAQYATECTHPTQTIEICDLQCVAGVSNYRDFCVDEYVEQISCLADGGYECVQNTPVPKAACTSQQVAYSQCVRYLPCKLYCRELSDIGCEEDEAACVDECIAEHESTDDLSCELRVDSYRQCIGLTGATCESGEVVPPPSCLYSLFEATRCKNEGDVCAAWCAGAKGLGCESEDCLGECQAQLEDVTCGSNYEDVLECAMRYGQVVCEGDQFISSSILCDSEIERYAECRMPTE